MATVACNVPDVRGASTFDLLGGDDGIEKKVDARDRDQNNRAPSVRDRGPFCSDILRGRGNRGGSLKMRARSSAG